MSDSSPPEKRSRKKAASSESYRKAFTEVFQELRAELTQEDLRDSEISDGIAHLDEVLSYNVPGGKCNRGLMVVGSLCHLVGDRELTPTEEKKAMILGWCVEWLQAFFLVADDIMDRSKMRRGKPCWYCKEGVGMIAVNDALWIEGTIYKILKRHFREEPYYLSVMELFHETTYQTELGQTLDMLTSSPTSDHVDFSRFSTERYEAIVKYKTAYYSFYLPVALAMYMAGITDEGAHKTAKSILLVMGEYFQIQDDYLDCYGDPQVIGKVGTDIEENKCSWLVVQALKRASPEQRAILQENYARDDPARVQKVKGVYRELDMEGAFRTYEESSYRSLTEMIDSSGSAASASLPKGMFLEYANRIYKRKS